MEYVFCVLIFLVPTFGFAIPNMVKFAINKWWTDMWGVASIILVAWVAAMVVWIIPMAIGECTKKFYFGAWESVNYQYILFADTYMEYGFQDIYFKDSGYVVFKVKYQDIEQIELDNNVDLLFLYCQKEQQNWDSPDKHKCYEKMQVKKIENGPSMKIPFFFDDMNVIVKELKQHTGLTIKEVNKSFKEICR